MGLFNIINYIVKGSLTSHVKMDPIMKMGNDKNTNGRMRKIVEDVSDDINPILGKSVRKINNVRDTVGNITDTLDNGLFRLGKYSKEHNFQEGDHLLVQRLGYTHHGLYIGRNEVIHYLSEGVRVDSLEEFADGAKIFQVNSPMLYERDEIVRRGRYRYYENQYNVIINNCESFVRWCRYGGESIE